MPIYVLVRFNLLLLTCYQRAMVDNHGYPTGAWYTMRTKFLPKEFQIWACFWEYIVIQYGQSRMTRTERRKAHRLILKMLSVEHVRIAWWKNSEHRTLRTRLVTDARLNGKTKERTKRKIFLTMGVQSDTMYSSERP